MIMIKTKDEIYYRRSCYNQESCYNQRSIPNLRSSYDLQSRLPAPRSGFTYLHSNFPDQGDISPPRNSIFKTKPFVININEDLQPYLDDENIIAEATLQENIDV